MFAYSNFAVLIVILGDNLTTKLVAVPLMRFELLMIKIGIYEFCKFGLEIIYCLKYLISTDYICIQVFN
jgi:hypothetical protein